MNCVALREMLITNVCTQEFNTANVIGISGWRKHCMVGEPDPHASQGMQIKRAVISSRANPNHSSLYFTHWRNARVCVLQIEFTIQVRGVWWSGPELRWGSACVTLSPSMR